MYILETVKPKNVSRDFTPRTDCVDLGYEKKTSECG